MIQCQEFVDSLGINFSIVHQLFALLVRHSDWLVNHLVSSDFQVEADERVIKTSPYESHTGNPAPGPTKLLNRILVGRRDGDDKQPRFQQAWFLGVTGGSGEVITLHPHGTQLHHGEWRESHLDDPEANARELQCALAQMSSRDWKTPACKTFEDTRCHKGLHSIECRARPCLIRCQTRCGPRPPRRDSWIQGATMHVL